MALNGLICADVSLSNYSLTDFRFANAFCSFKTFVWTTVQSCFASW